MANWRDLLGTFQTFFRIGGTGSAGIKSVDASTLEMRNSADAAQGRLRGADPLAAQDYVTKNHFDTVAPGVTPAGAIGVIEVPVPFGAAGDVLSAANIPASAKVLDSRLFVTAAFDGGATLRVRSNDDTVEVQTTAQNDPSAIAGYLIDQRTVWSASGVAADRTVKVTRTGTSTVGQAFVQVLYSEPVA